VGSTIIEVRGGSWKVVREGAIPIADIEKALK
jgi:tRNA A37 threonylcarbamoyladenosine synthetase subunit TsaC/SUA5/YrdC